jgi:hypothetical protein
MKEKWFPIQAVHTLFNSCAFVVLSGNVTHEEVWRKWRELDRPEWWKVMTKVEHTKRTEEYLELLKEEQPGKKIRGAEKMPTKELPKPKESTAEEAAQTAPTASAEAPEKKRKRGKKKRNRPTNEHGANQTDVVDKELDHAGHADAEAATELSLEPSSKKAKLSS